MLESISTSSSIAFKRHTYNKKKLKNISESGDFFFGNSGSLRIKPNNNTHLSSPEITPVKVSLDDLDELIAALSPDELSELSKVDPDDSSMPPSMRCVYKCEKKGSSTMNRNAMLNQLKENALKTPDQEEKFVPKEGIPLPTNSESDDEDPPPIIDQPCTLDQEYISVLENASLQEIVEMADILGITFQDNCKATELNLYPKNESNDTDIEEIYKLIAANSPEVIDVNFNNIKGISKAYWERFFEALGTNEVVESLTATNTGINDPIALLIFSCLKNNRTLRSLTLDSNLISGGCLLKLIRASSINKSLEELRVSHQMNCRYLGHQTESDIAHALQNTPNLVKLGVTMEFRDSLNKTAVALQKNLDKRRLCEDRSVTLKLDGKEGPSLLEK
ncbi:tropomodulin-1 isoform X2 [Lepeophtheirus salmonis]|uniref:tropomodulin-1 isoform X2 n=1 Tax=Lepeophtheirus salmonis TaxID=72036 RepID=UPI003AF35B23